MSEVIDEPGYYYSALPMPHGGTVAATDGGNGYKAVQRKLKVLGDLMVAGCNELESTLRNMRANAERTEKLAAHIAHADLDPKFVEMTNQVAVALGGAAVEVQTLHAAAQEVSDLAHGAKRTHASLYEELDDVRSSRPERTPKPDFFSN
ncbi:conjugal transfer protein TraB [Streptomyces sp. 039-1]|uniref:conjugal transfer protein TraB n=1 Tax=Streptomyces sp. 039-1 TaxID=2789263 RepID=UPI0039F55249